MKGYSFEKAKVPASITDHQRALYRLLCEFDRVCHEIGVTYYLFAGSLLGAVRHSGFIPWDDDLDVIMMRCDYQRFLNEAPAIIDSERFFIQQENTKHWPMFFSKLRLNGTACLEKYHPKDNLTHQGIYMDIFPCDNAFESGFLRKLQFVASKVLIAKGLYKRGYDTDCVIKKIFMSVCCLLPSTTFLFIVKGPKKEGNYLHGFLGGASRYAKSVFPRECFEQVEKHCFEKGEYPIPAGYDKLLKILYGDYMTLPPEEDRKCKQHAILVDLTKSYEHYANYRDGMTFEVKTRSIR